MGRLIDVDEVKKRFPIMENDFGMVINERLHKELDKIPTVEAIPKADYENRLKADMVAMLEDLNLEIDEMFARRIDYTADRIQDLIQQKIDLLQKQTTDNCDNCFNGTTKGGCAVKELMKNKDCKYYIPRKTML